MIFEQSKVINVLAVFVSSTHPFSLAAKKETYARFMQFKDETNTDILDEVLLTGEDKRTKETNDNSD